MDIYGNRTHDDTGIELMGGRGPTWSKPCERCGETVERYRGEGDVQCPGCLAWYNAGGQRLRDDWWQNEAWQDDDMDDMEGFEREMLNRDIEAERLGRPLFPNEY